MFTLAQSIWMFSATGIIVPVIIHLWNRKQGKTLKVGSISLLTESYKQQAKNIQLRERLLLLLRCLTILILAVLLSRPIWVKQMEAGKDKGWILIEKKNFSETYARFKPVIDSLLEKKYEFHYFNGGFQKEEFSRALETKNDTLTEFDYSYWTLLSNLDQQVPPTLPVYLFTTKELKRFSGKRPELAMNLQWHTYTPADSVSEWITKAYMTGKDSVRLVTATSRPFGTSYAFKNTSFNGVNLPATADKNVAISYSNNKEVRVDTATLNVTVYTDKNFKDAAYVKAAFDAIKKFNRRKIAASIVRKTEDIPAGQDWLFWLTDQPLKVSGAKNVFIYVAGKPENVASFINAEMADEYLPLNKRVVSQGSSNNAEVLWQDGFGTPVLSLEKGEPPVYHFFSRFDPAWSDLTWHEAFPRLIFNLVYGGNTYYGDSDNREVDDRQSLPVFSSTPAAINKAKFTETYDLSQAFWLAAFLLFFIERIISFRAKVKKANA